jgi:hypothetical protein
MGGDCSTIAVVALKGFAAFSSRCFDAARVDIPVLERRKWGGELAARRPCLL